MYTYHIYVILTHNGLLHIMYIYYISNIHILCTRFLAFLCCRARTAASACSPVFSCRIPSYISCIYVMNYTYILYITYMYLCSRTTTATSACSPLFSRRMAFYISYIYIYIYMYKLYLNIVCTYYILSQDGLLYIIHIYTHKTYYTYIYYMYILYSLAEWPPT